MRADAEEVRGETQDQPGPARGEVVVTTDPAGPGLPPLARPAHRAPRLEVRQHLRQREPGRGEDRRPGPGGGAGQLRGPHQERHRHPGVHGARAVRRGLRRARGHLLVRHVHHRAGHARVSVQRMQKPSADLQARHRGCQARGARQDHRRGSPIVRPEVHRPHRQETQREGADGGPFPGQDGHQGAGQAQAHRRGGAGGAQARRHATVRQAGPTITPRVASRELGGGGRRGIRRG